MAKFTDTIIIRIKAGDGGPGALSFRREKYAPKGGPDGGDGGRGGSVYFQADRRYYNLSHYLPDKIYKARNGAHGRGRNMYGADGEDLIIPLPPGTQIIDCDTQELIADLVEEGERFCAAKGGIGGKGNAFFKSSTHQTPRMAQKGMPGEELSVRLDLKLIADIGLVGLPNAGKSTLLSVLTAAKPKIADYPFTTLTPNLGILVLEDKIIRIADIPGIIEGAHKGVGLGLSFLQHIERVRAILYLIDATGSDIAYTLELLRSELKSYNEKLPLRPYYVLLTKSDLISPEDSSSKEEELKGEPVILFSSLEGHNVDKLLKIIESLMEEYDAA
ncbi:MAG: GTPase ObgE [Leptospirales bacterium]|nr:GTPase ObgE [Leptospirales bacterium]